jgi:hypothetical protein
LLTMFTEFVGANSVNKRSLLQSQDAFSN